jgi:hypothetical protein
VLVGAGCCCAGVFLVSVCTVLSRVNGAGVTGPQGDSITSCSNLRECEEHLLVC